MRVDSIGEETAKIIHSWQDHADPLTEIREAAERGIAIVTQDDADYPAPLREAYDPPLLLYVWGKLEPRDRHAISVVGSRRAIGLAELGPELARGGRASRVSMPLVANDELLGLLVADGSTAVDLARVVASQTATSRSLPAARSPWASQSGSGSVSSSAKAITLP